MSDADRGVYRVRGHTTVAGVSKIYEELLANQRIEIARLRSQLVEARDVNRRMDQSFGEIEVEARAKAIEECAEAVQLTECGYAAMRFQTRAIENIRTLATTSEKRNG